MSERHGNPDKGPPMKWGAHSFDKGYTSDSEMSHGGIPGEQRGNNYFSLQNSYLAKDRAKLSRNKFSKIA